MDDPVIIEGINKMKYKVGDLTHTNYYPDDIFIVTGLNQFNPDSPSWLGKSVRIEFLYSATREEGHTNRWIRYLDSTIFEKEWVIL